MPASWSVHATVDEPLALIQAFVAHHLHLGAAEVHLALDRPEEAVIAALRVIDGVTLTICDDRWWQMVARGLRPGRTVQRQAINATRFYRSMTTDWMLSCDADEFLWPQRPVSDILDDTPGDQPFRVFPVAERALRRGRDHILRGPFRLFRPQPGSSANTYFADGFLGHIKGKSIIRRGLPVRIATHRPIWPDAVLQPPAGYPDLPARTDEALLLHFDGLTPLHLLLKCLRWYDNGLADAGGDPAAIKFTRKSTRNHLIQHIHVARQDPAALTGILDQVLLSADALAHLRAQGALLDLDLDLSEALTRHLTGAPPDLSVTTFDRDLRLRHRDLIARHGAVLPEG